MQANKALLDVIRQMKAGNAFKGTIEYVRFPFFRNLERDTRISLDFPLTVFVGQNGSGKSSTLQALYGCPAGKSIETFWFSTEVDPILEGEDGERHCVIYGYNDAQKNLLEVVKRRIKDANNPELWETSDPLKQYGMDPKAKRNEPLAKEVLYLDFRSIRSAFERAFQRLRSNGEKPQDFLRYRSWYLQRALKRNCAFSKPRSNPPQILSDIELEEISGILGKSYAHGVLILNHIFGEWGFSVKFTTAAAASYSEAFAGSGETAVVILVHAILNAKPESLILLDEPETSLHPGAQSKVQEFLLRQIIKQRHQVVVSTHSQALVAGLPQEAIKVFCPNSKGKFAVLGNVLPEEAFFFIGQPILEKRRIIVEDRLGKALVDAAIAGLGAQTAALFDVEYFPGGHGGIKQDISRYCREKGWRTFVIFDGDQTPKTPVFDPKTLTVAQLHDQPVETVKFLDSEIMKQTGGKIGFSVDSDGKAGGGNKQQEIASRCEYLSFYGRNVFYLPWASPEHALWHKQTAESLIDLTVDGGKAAELKAHLEAEPSVKKRFAFLADAVAGGSEAQKISAIHGIFVKAFIKQSPDEFAKLVALAQKIRAIAEN